MITENNITGLLRAEKRNFNNERRIYYHIGSRQSLMQLQNKKDVDAKMLKRLLIEMNEILSTLTQYLLDADALLLIPECIYLSSADETISFCLYPYEKRDIRQQFRELSEYFLERINREDEQAVRLAFQLYRMTREPNFVFSEIVEKLVYKEVKEYEKRAESTYEQQDSEWLSDKGPSKWSESENQSRAHLGQPYEDTKEKQNHNEAKQHKDNLVSVSYVTGKTKFLLLNIALTVGSFLYVVYVYAVKQYFYGYSFLQVLSTFEAIFSLGLFGVFWLISLILYFLQRKRVHLN